MAEFAVMAESHSGKVHQLRGGFENKEAAEDHPVIAAHWKRVWVEPVKPKPMPIETPPPLPWSLEWVGRRTYLRDAEDRRIATIWGTQKRREHIERMLTEAGLLRPPAP